MPLKGSPGRSANGPSIEMEISINELKPSDLPRVTQIYNQGIEDRVATLELDPKTQEEVARQLTERDARFEVLVARDGQQIVGWASLNPYSHRCAYAGVADLSIYVARDARGKGVGERLLVELERRARARDFHKIVLFTFPFNEAAQRLYRRRGFREVGVFKEQGQLDGRFVDCMIMEKLL